MSSGDLLPTFFLRLNEVRTRFITHELKIKTRMIHDQARVRDRMTCLRIIKCGNRLARYESILRNAVLWSGLPRLYYVKAIR